MPCCSLRSRRKRGRGRGARTRTRHILSVRALEEMCRYICISLVGALISMQGSSCLSIFF